MEASETCVTRADSVNRLREITVEMSGFKSRYMMHYDMFRSRFGFAGVEIVNRLEEIMDLLKNLGDFDV